MNETHQWIRLDRNKLSKPENIPLNGVLIGVQLSPWDVPDGVKGYHDKEEDRFRIDFRYSDSESEKRVGSRNDEINLLVGRYSGKIISILVETEKTGVDAVMLAVERLSKGSFNKRREPLNARRNRELVTGVLRSKGEKLTPV